MNTSELRARAAAMAAALAHRGPDAQGDWASEPAGVAMGHARLAVLDPSEAGAQPMTSPDGRYTLVYNGEIYNHPELRAELGNAGQAFASECDTETLLTAIAAWGLDTALERATGMFALGLWDATERKLFLARDRLGIKPLYYGRAGASFAFASELKAFAALPEWHRRVNRDALALYLRHGYVPEPYCMIEALRKLHPGEILELGDPTAALDEIPRRRFWSATDVLRAGRDNPFLGTLDDATDETERLLDEAIRMRLLSDVPLGAFLSGGIDSSLVAAVMQRHTGSTRTFSIAFDDPRMNEAPFAAAVADHLGTEHTELTASAAAARALVPELPRLYDEPFGDASQIPTVLLSRLTRKHVTVALSGDGGDEIFGGYPRYAFGQSFWSRAGWMPRILRQGLAAGIDAIPLPVWEKACALARPLAPALFAHRRAGDIMPRLAQALRAASPDDLYPAWRCFWLRETPMARPVADLFAPILQNSAHGSIVRRMMLLDMLTYLPGDILAKVDRAGMSCGLEVRVPLLDHRLFSFAARLPDDMLIDRTGGKVILRRLLARYVPPALFERPKKGFGVPLADWLRTDLRDWAEALLAPARLRQESYFDPGTVTAAWASHRSGREDRKDDLWPVLMFQAWLERAPHD